MKQNDTAPELVYDLVDNFGLPGETAMDLTNATSVTFKMRAEDASAASAPLISRAMTIDDADGGRVVHTWVEGDTDTPGSYRVEFEILWSDGTIETVPNDGYMTLVIVDDLDANV